MKLVNYRGRAGVLFEDGLADVHQLTGGAFGPDTRSCLDDWDRFRAVIDAATNRTPTVTKGKLDEADLGPPVPEPRQIFAIGLNYADHAEEANIPKPEFPVVFTKFVSSLTGPRATVSLPSDTVDYEAELVAVIGREARNVPAADAWSYVAGFMVGQDISERTVQIRGAAAQWSIAKSFPGFSPCGPALVTLDEIASPADLAISCRMGAEVLQNSRTSRMIFPVPELIRYLSSILPLLPGDLIFTGTPAGVGLTRKPPRLLRPGETLITEIEGVGRLTTTFT